MLDLTALRAELAAHYDLAPSVALAEDMADVHARSKGQRMPYPSRLSLLTAAQSRRA